VAEEGNEEEFRLARSDKPQPEREVVARGGQEVGIEEGKLTL
jgi:hypothetical protein